MEIYFQVLPQFLPPCVGAEKQEWTLVVEWAVTIDGKELVIPAGTTTDGASIPRILWRVCGHPMQSPRIYAALVHDYLYSIGGDDDARLRADKIYRDMLISFGVSCFAAYTEYYAIRWFGGSHWRACALLAALALMGGCMDPRTSYIDGWLVGGTSTMLFVGYGNYIEVAPGGMLSRSITNSVDGASSASTLKIDNTKVVVKEVE